MTEVTFRRASWVGRARVYDDFVPSDEYDADDSDEAIAAAEAIVGCVRA